MPSAILRTRVEMKDIAITSYVKSQFVESNTGIKNFERLFKKGDGKVLDVQLTVHLDKML
jgi:hypothetical protein